MTSTLSRSAALDCIIAAWVAMIVQCFGTIVQVILAIVEDLQENRETALSLATAGRIQKGCHVGPCSKTETENRALAKPHVEPPRPIVAMPGKGSPKSLRLTKGGTRKDKGEEREGEKN